MQRKTVKNKVEEDKVKGAAVYFVTGVGTQPQQDTEPDKEPSPQPDPQPEPQPDKEPDTGTGTVMGTDTELQEFLKPSETYIRKVYYPLEEHDKYIKKKAAKYKKSESEILRFLLDYAIKNVKI